MGQVRASMRQVWRPPSAAPVDICPQLQANLRLHEPSSKKVEIFFRSSLFGSEGMTSIIIVSTEEILCLV